MLWSGLTKDDKNQIRSVSFSFLTEFGRLVVKFVVGDVQNATQTDVVLWGFPSSVV